MELHLEDFNRVMMEPPVGIPDGLKLSRLSEFETGDLVEDDEFPARICRIPPELLGARFLTSTGKPSHFKAYELCNREHELVLHPLLIDALENTRSSLHGLVGHHRIGICVTSGFRSPADQRRLAVVLGLGWTDERPPGKVSRQSKHRLGLAADIYAYDWQKSRRVSKTVLARVARRYFPFIKQYPDTGHLHVDLCPRG